jgi:hypothetical protein
MTINKTVIYFFVLFASAIGLHCTDTGTSKSQKAEYKSIYIDQFKLTYFRKMLIKGYNNSEAIQEIIQSDYSGFTEPILTMEDYKLIDSLTSVHYQKIKTDSANSIGRVAEGGEGKHILGFILDKLESKWLDSIANKRYKKSGVRSF